MSEVKSNEETDDEFEVQKNKPDHFLFLIFFKMIMRSIDESRHECKFSKIFQKNRDIETFVNLKNCRCCIKKISDMICSYEFISEKFEGFKAFQHFLNLLNKRLFNPKKKPVTAFYFNFNPKPNDPSIVYFKEAKSFCMVLETKFSEKTHAPCNKFDDYRHLGFYEMKHTEITSDNVIDFMIDLFGCLFEKTKKIEEIVDLYNQ